MSELLSTRLHHLTVLSVTGKDAVKFLQGQCTQDVANLAINSAAAGAFCTAKGRMVTNVRLVKRTNDCIWIICHANSAELLNAHLTKYVAFFRGTELKPEADNYVSYGINSSFYQAVRESNDLSDSVVHFSLAEDLNYLWLPTVDQNTALTNLLDHHDILDAGQWRALEIRQKLLWLDEKQVEVWIPQNISLDDVDGICYTKGCYTGQEVIARLHYKGQSKKSLYAVTWNEQTESIKIFAQGKAIGDVIQYEQTAVGYIGLAILKTGSVAAPLYIDEHQQQRIELLN